METHAHVHAFPHPLPPEAFRWQIHQGDVREVLRTLPADSVHCVMTSPPYWGLRDYGVAGQIGLEATAAEHIAALVEVFREVRRVLRPDGTLWVNYGDCYAAEGVTASKPRKREELRGGGCSAWSTRDVTTKQSTAVAGLKPKDLVMMPARLALALQADGWWLRSEIVWAKANPMPESVTDRPTSAHEKVFLLAPSARYFYDAEAVRERDSGRDSGNVARRYGEDYGAPGNRRGVSVPWTAGAGRNLRNVWTIPTQPFPEAHFATFPEALVRPCILAGTSEAGCCPECGAPWERVVEPSEEAKARMGASWVDHAEDLEKGRRGCPPALKGAARVTTGFQPTCTCPPATPIPCTVLDPFAGSGTTGVVTVRHGRAFVGVELNPEYAEMARRRVDRANRGYLAGGDQLDLEDFTC